MALSANEAALLQAIWAKVAPQTSQLGGEALERLFLSFPQTKTYFPHFDMSHASSDLLNHGGKVLNALGNAVNHLDDLDGHLSNLSDLHAYILRVDPGNFDLLSHTIQVVLAAHFQADFTPEAQSAWDKFISKVSAVLTSKYR